MAQTDPGKERQQRLVLQFMVAFWAMLAAVVFFMSPHLRAAVRDRRAAGSLMQKVERAIQMSDVKDAVTARVEGWGATIEKIEGSMLRGDAFNYLVREVSAIARGLDVEVVSIRPDYSRTNRPRQGFDYVDARSVLEVSASFDAIGELVAALERLTPMLSVQLIEVTAGSPPRHRAKLELSMLHMPAESGEDSREPPPDRGGGRSIKG